MIWDDLKRLLSGPTLFRLDAVIAARLVPILYAVGIAAIGLWAIDHLFASFAYNFGQGLWGILEIIVYAPLWLIALRIVCELVLVFFKSHESAADAVNHGRRNATLLDEVGEAIHDLADDDDPAAGVTDPSPFAGGPGSPGGAVFEPDPGSRPVAVRRTARRTPPTAT